MSETLKFKTAIMKFDRANRADYLPLLDDAVESRLLFRTSEIEVIYTEYIEGTFEIPEMAVVLTPEETKKLSEETGAGDVKIKDGRLYFKKYKSGGRIGRNGVEYQNERKALRVNPE